MGTPLQTFLLQFGTEGLSECAAEINKTEKEIDKLEKKEKELQEVIKKGGEEAENAKTELENVTKSLKEQKEHLTKLQHSWQGTLLKFKESAAVVTKIVGSFAALGKAVHQTIKYASEASALGEMADNAGIAADRFQDLTNAVKHYGGSAEQTGASLAMLNDSLANIRKGGDGNGLKEMSAKLGISTNVADADEYFEHIASKMETLKTQSEKNDLGRSLGLDDATIKLLSGGLANYRKELEKVNKYKVFTKEDIERSRDFEMTMRDIRMGSAAIGANLAQMLLPAINLIAKGIKKVVDFFVEHSPFIKMVLTVIGFTLIPLIIQGIWGIAKAFVGLMLANPILSAIVLAILGILLLIDDLYAWLDGGESRFGKFWEALFGPADKARKALKEAFEDIKKAFQKSFGDGLVEIGKKTCELLVNIFKNFYNNIWQKMPAWLRLIIQGTPLGVPITVFEVADKVKKKFKKNPVDGSHASGLDYVPFDGYLAELHKGERVQTADEAASWRKNLAAAKNALAITSNVNLNAIPGGSISSAYNNSSSSKSITIGDITIQTAATDASGIANDLVRSIKQAVINLDDGMLA